MIFYMKVIAYRTLPSDAQKLRGEVFINEQNFPYDYDEKDNTATHIVMYSDKTAVACCRYFPIDTNGTFTLGRFAVKKELRGKGLGKILLEETEKLIKSDGGKQIAISAQLHAKDFYSKQGYTAFGEVFYEEHCPHIKMKKTI